MQETRKAETKKFLIVWSKTHYGRNTPPSESENKEQIADACRRLQMLGIKEVRATFDEDYGWAIEVDQNRIDQIMNNNPELSIKKVYETGEIVDKDGQEVAVIQETDKILSGLIPVSFDTLWKDWKENYGCE